jgi:hypothetical protein
MDERFVTLTLYALGATALVAGLAKAKSRLVALKMYWKKGRVKVSLGIGKGKDSADKRADLKKRVQEREVQRDCPALSCASRRRSNYKPCKVSRSDGRLLVFRSIPNR